MPYNSPDEVAKKVPGAAKLSEKKRRQFMEVWKSVYEKGGDESSAFAQAWGVVKKSSCDCPNCGYGQMIGPAESDGSLADATLNKDILDAHASIELLAIAKEIGRFHPSTARLLTLESRMI